MVGNKLFKILMLKIILKAKKPQQLAKIGLESFNMKKNILKL
jgi:hypothetical protein